MDEIHLLLTEKEIITITSLDFVTYFVGLLSALKSTIFNNSVY